MGTSENTEAHYAAFISYAHADEVMAARLHKALETYPVPKHLRAEGKATKPVFRDVAELTAAHSLSEKIRDAVKGSRVLIVLCSPAAKASHWVNEEIRLFRELHGDASILSAIIEGTPETAFPDALTEGGREPLAAALGTEKSGFKLGVTQLAAGMLGTGLDDLVQRAARRRNRIMGGGLAASLALSGIMGFTAFQAVEARNEAQLERAESEALLEYMVKDLKVKLEPAGRLELLEGVGRRAIEYYDEKDIVDLSDDNLTTFAAARQVIGQVALDAGRMEEAQSEIEAAADLTREVLERNPDNTDAIFAHAQSEYWVGAYYFNRNEFDKALPYMERYNELAQILYKKDSKNFEYIMEAAWGAKNLGMMFIQKNTYQDATTYLSQALEYFELAKNKNSDDYTVENEIASTLGFISDASERNGPATRAFEARDKQVQYYLSHKDLLNNFDLKYRYSEARFLRVRLSTLIAGHENLNMDFMTVISDLEVLTDHDPNNLLWQRTLLRAYIDYYFYSDDVVLRNKLRAKIMNLKTMFLLKLEDKNILEIFYTELIEDNKISETYQFWGAHFPKSSEENAIISSELINSNTEFLNNYNLEKYANVIIDHYQKNFNSIEPKAIQRLVKAHLVLGQCEAASKKARALIKRGYKAPNLSVCR